MDASTAPDGGSGAYDFVVRCPVCYDRQAARRRKEAACIGDFHLSDFNWAEYPGAEGIEQKRNLIEKYVEHFADFERRGYGLYIHGGIAGSGKTYLAQCLAGELMEHWNEGSARLCTESDLLELSRRKPEDGGDPLEAVISCRLLILDDYGQKRTGRSWIDDVAFRVIDRRYRAHRVTLLTQNLPIDRLPDSRIADRINAASIALKMPDVAVRSQAAAEEKAAFLKEIGIT